MLWIISQQGKASDWWVEKQKVSSQFSGQLWIAAQLGEPLAGVVLNVIEIPEPHKSDRKCAEHKVSYQECSVRHAGNHLVYVTRAPVEMASWEMSARTTHQSVRGAGGAGRGRGIGGGSQC